MNQPGFFVRVIVFFVPLVMFLILMAMAGITDNLFMTIILSLAFVWMLQRIYKIVLKKMEEKKANK
ncbi:MAG: hypothetical protein Q4B18_01875 [Bacillota bacterium]|nr:hypothetical protein [Bacillota bacterium]